MKPHYALQMIRPDEIAECWEGVSDELYMALWESMNGMKPLSEQIDIEESGPGDALGLNSVASVWDKFTDDQKQELNELAEGQ